MNKVLSLTADKERQGAVEKAVDRVKDLGRTEKEPPGYFISPSEISKKLVLCCGGRNK